MTALVVVLVALVALLAGCTGVPQSSRPEVVKPLPGGGDVTQPPPVRPHDLVPHDLVAQFLSLNSLPTGNYASARNFLTPAAQARWQDTSATSDVVYTTTIGLFNPRRPQIVVHGRVLGRLSPSGVYAPQLPAQETAFVFRIANVHGQYRISGLPPGIGLLLTESQFETSFDQRSLYYFDLAEKYLVPDPRWTPLTDPTQLDEWLMTQLSGGPSQQLANSVTPLPTQDSARRINVTVGTPTKIEIPGSSQLGSSARVRLAAQIATTLDNNDQRTIEITDGGSPVNVPNLGRNGVTSADFSDELGPPKPAGDVYFVRDGKLVSGHDFKTVKGDVNNGDFLLGSIAVSRSGPTGELSVAALAAVGVKEELLVGTQAAGLHVTPVQGGSLARPAFAPGRDEVWVGGVGDAGSKIDVVNLAGRTPKVTPVGLPSSPGGQITALRLSPEGSRIAMVIKSPTGSQQLYIGSIVRSGAQVRIDSLQQISPPNVTVNDVGWIEATKLYAIGYTGTPDEGNVYETDVDGSVWTAMGIGGMPANPATFTVTPGEPGWSASDATLWVQSGGSNWKSAGPTGQTPGTNPVYLG